MKLVSGGSKVQTQIGPGQIQLMPSKAALAADESFERPLKVAPRVTLGDVL